MDEDILLDEHTQDIVIQVLSGLAIRCGNCRLRFQCMRKVLFSKSNDGTPTMAEQLLYIILDLGKQCGFDEANFSTNCSQVNSYASYVYHYMGGQDKQGNISRKAHKTFKGIEYQGYIYIHNGIESFITDNGRELMIEGG